MDKVEHSAQQLRPVTFYSQLEEAFGLISYIEKISLEVEMGYNDVEERCRLVTTFSFIEITVH